MCTNVSNCNLEQQPQQKLRGRVTWTLASDITVESANMFSSKTVCIGSEKTQTAPQLSGGFHPHSEFGSHQIC